MGETPRRGAVSADRLTVAANDLLSQVADLSDEVMAWKPAPDVWSVMEILCHVAEFVPYWTGQALQVIHHPDQQWGRTHGDTARNDAVHAAGSRTRGDVTAAIRAGADASAATLRRLTDAELATEATSRNPRWDRKPASFIVDDLIIGHVEKHLGQIRRNMGQYGEGSRLGA